MRGLLLKDFYMTKKYCKIYLLMVVVFVTVSFFNNETLFWAFYPCLLCGIIPANLLSYDEHSKWTQYSETLPYTKAQLVSAKYLIGLAVQLVTLLYTGIGQAIRMNLDQSFSFNAYFLLMGMLLAVSLISPAICLPFMFKFGVEKGRIAYYVMIGFVCGASVIAARFFKAEILMKINQDLFLPIVCAVGILIYALSWYLSIVFYQKREL